jgi:hypothetical protein
MIASITRVEDQGLSTSMHNQLARSVAKPTQGYKLMVNVDQTFAQETIILSFTAGKEVVFTVDLTKLLTKRQTCAIWLLSLSDVTQMKSQMEEVDARDVMPSLVLKDQIWITVDQTSVLPTKSRPEMVAATHAISVKQ